MKIKKRTLKKHLLNWIINAISLFINILNFLSPKIKICQSISVDFHKVKCESLQATSQHKHYKLLVLYWQKQLFALPKLNALKGFKAYVRDGNDFLFDLHIVFLFTHIWGARWTWYLVCESLHFVWARSWLSAEIWPAQGGLKHSLKRITSAQSGQ